MNKKTTGILVGAGIGFGLAWLFGRRGQDDQERIIILKTRPDGTAGIEKAPDDVEIRAGKRLTWWVANQSNLEVDVSLQHWTDAGGRPRPPAVDPDPEWDDRDQQDGLFRRVPPGQVRKIRAKARRPMGLFEEVYYDVYLNGSPGVDPIVKLVL
jgi:hypothetical protein